MDALGNTPYIVIVGYVNGDVEYYGPFKSMKRADEYGTAALKSLNAQRFYVANLCRSFNDQGFDPV